MPAEPGGVYAASEAACLAALRAEELCGSDVVYELSRAIISLAEATRGLADQAGQRVRRD
jgi:hypothetical protein